MEVQVLSSAWPPVSGAFRFSSAGYEPGLDVKAAGRAGLFGPRGKLGRRAADAVGRKTRLDRHTVEAAIGAVLFALSVKHVLQTLRRMRRGETG